MAKKNPKKDRRLSIVRKLIATEEPLAISADGTVTRLNSIENKLKQRKQPGIGAIPYLNPTKHSGKCPLKPGDIVSAGQIPEGKLAIADGPTEPSLEDMIREALDRNDAAFVEQVAKVMRGVKNRKELRELNKELTALLWKAAQGPVNVAALARELCQPERDLIEQIPRGTKRTERMARMENMIEAIDKRLRRYCEQIGVRVARPGRPRGNRNVDK